MADQVVPIAIVPINGPGCRSNLRANNRRGCAPVASGTLAPTPRVTQPAALQRPLPGSGLGGAAAAWPLAAVAQQGNRVRRIGVLVAGDENDPMMKPRVFAFERAL